MGICDVQRSAESADISNPRARIIPQGVYQLRARGQVVRVSRADLSRAHLSVLGQSSGIWARGPSSLIHRGNDQIYVGIFIMIQIRETTTKRSEKLNWWRIGSPKNGMKGRKTEKRRFLIRCRGEGTCWNSRNGSGGGEREGTISGFLTESVNFDSERRLPRRLSR
jgi:hypothetical protein